MTVVLTSAVTSSGPATTTYTVTLPASIAANDSLLLWIVTGGATITTPAGWTAAVTALGTDPKGYLFYKTAASGSEGTSLAVTVSSAEQMVAVAYRCTGTDYSGTPFTFGTGATGSSTSPAASVTTVVANTVVVGFAGVETFSGTTGAFFTPPGSWAEDQDARNASGFRGATGAEIAQASTGSVTGTFTTTGSPWSAVLVAVNPPVDGGAIAAHWTARPPGLFLSPAGFPQWTPNYRSQDTNISTPVSDPPSDGGLAWWTLRGPGPFVSPANRFLPLRKPDPVPTAAPSTSVPVSTNPLTVTTSTATPTGILYSTVDVYLNGLKQSTLEIISGSVTMSETQGVRRQCAVEAVNHDLAPSDMADLLAPKGTELWITSGVDDAQYPVGVFRLVTSEIDTKGEATTLKLAGQDRSNGVSVNQWTSPYQPTTGTTIDQAISAILTDRYPTLPQLIASTNYPTPAGLVFGLQMGNDPWKDCQALATSAGLVLFIDATGTARLQEAVPDPDNVKARFVHGGGLLHALNRKLDSSQTFNGVLAIGESPGRTTVSALVWDTDTTSGSYYLGAFGQRPTSITSPLITTPDQATAAATAELSRHLGLLESLHISGRPDASLEGGDVCVVGHPTARADGMYVVSAFTLPLTPGAMTIDFRARRVL